jgi:hypothetical protein
MLLTTLLTSLSFSLATAYTNSSQLLPRQTACNPVDQPVRACGGPDLTTANWQAFNIDDFLSNFILNFGTGSVSGIGFPSFFVNNNVPPSTAFDFTCTGPDSICIHPPQLNPDIGDDCAFTGIPGVSETVCGKYVSPEAGFVVENYIRFHAGVSNTIRALDDARNNILGSQFIEQVVDGLSEEQGNLLDAIFQAIFSLFIDLPFGGALKIAAKLFSGVNTVLGFIPGQSNLGDVTDVIRTVIANDAIQDLAERTKDQMRRQVEADIDGLKAKMQSALDVIFGTGPGSAAAQEGIQNQDNLAIQLAQSGIFLDRVPSQGELAASITENLQHQIVSGVMNGMNWGIIFDEFILMPVEQERACQDGFKGITGINGVQCAFFRENADINGKKPQDPKVLKGLIDTNEMVRNAVECNGGTANPEEAVLEDAPGLSRCMYNFRAVQGRGV